jgi:hypothetical protein
MIHFKLIVHTKRPVGLLLLHAPLLVSLQSKPLIFLVTKLFLELHIYQMQRQGWETLG